MNKSPNVLTRSLAVMVLGAGIFSAAAWAAQSAQSAKPAQAQSAPKPVNKLCPIMEHEVDVESPTRQFKGVTIGFCCPGCDRKWDRQSDEAKMALLSRMAPEAIAAINAVSSPALRVARDYLVACGKADATALDALFLDKGRATVTENAGDEGTWETYRDHHLLPELTALPGFAMTVTRDDVQTFGTTSIVRQVGSFTVPVPNHPDAPARKYLAAVTYVVVDDNGTPKIAHLHWSSRADTKAGADATPAADAGPGGGSSPHGR